MKYWNAILFVAIEFLLFGLHYIFFEHLWFIQNDYILAFFLIIPAIIFIAYVWTLIASQEQESQNEMLEHLIKESLHEINLPIATIDANIQMLKRKLKDDKDIKRAQRIAESLDRLKRLYSHLSYNIKREVVPIEKEIFDLKELVTAKVEFFASLNRNKFVLNLKPMKIFADKIGLEQVVDNIIENSMKYSDKNRKIEISIEETKLIIKDYGIGIDENELSMIYQRYYQSDNKFIGDGIGLSIVKRYCDTEGIGLKIESKRGQGTSVELDFKRALKG